MNPGTDRRSASWIQRLFLLAFGTALPLVGLEIGLQVSALHVHWTASDAASTAGERELCVLCVGDSFTYGIGASGDAGSYPSQLQRYLDDQDPGRWRVVNEGWAGRNSAIVSHELAGWIDEHEPSHLAILIGHNNQWNAELTEVALPEASVVASRSGRDRSSWRWRWRSLRLLRILYHATLKEPPPPPVVISDEAFGQPFEEAARDRRLPCDPSELDAPARACWDQILEIAQDAATGPDRAARELRGIERSEVLRPGRFPVALRYLEVLDRLLLHEQVVDFCEAATATFGPRPEFDLLGMLHQVRLGHHDAARAALSRTKAAFPGSAMAWTRIGKVHWVLREDAAAAEAWLRSYALDGDDERLRVGLRKLCNVRELAPDAMRRAIESTPGLADGVADRIQDHYRQLDQARGRSKRLERDLNYQIKLALALDVQPILQTYPNPGHHLQHRITALGPRRGVPVVDHAASFERWLEDEPSDTYFVADGHCNDRGYAEMARRLGETLLRSR